MALPAPITPLVEFAMQVVPGRISCVPYHAGALYPVEHRREDSIIVARPGVYRRD